MGEVALERRMSVGALRWDAAKVRPLSMTFLMVGRREWSAICYVLSGVEVKSKLGGCVSMPLHDSVPGTCRAYLDGCRWA